ncbi:MAG: DnaJ domain-containing protein [Gammaproteobacteria bacterium]|nr:DnaJ domain-containing protein [Gammaproteobacteria bacterium]
MKYKDYYETLGVPRSASGDEIKRAYRRLARKFHPDVSKEANAEERFKDIGEAYEVLKDAEKRAAYDQLGSNWKAGQDFRPPPGWQQRGGGGFGAGSDIFSEFFEDLFGRSRAAGARPRPATGEDVRTQLSITLEEAFSGGERVLRIDDPEKGERRIKVKIPKGVTEDQQIRMAGLGRTGMAARPGDLYLSIKLDAHPQFQVEGRDIHLDLPITPWEAALGATVTAPTLSGAVNIKIPPGSQSGKKLKIPNRGLGQKPAGDLIVALQIVVPAADTDAAKALYAQMAEEMDFDPRSDLGV